MTRIDGCPGMEVVGWAGLWMLVQPTNRMQVSCAASGKLLGAAEAAPIAFRGPAPTVYQNAVVTLPCSAKTAPSRESGSSARPPAWQVDGEHSLYAAAVRPSRIVPDRGGWWLICGHAGWGGSLAP